MTLRLREHDLHWREIDDEIVVLNERDAEYLAIQGSGTLVWRLLSESTTKDALVDAFVDTYIVDRTCAAADIDAFLALLAERDLLAS